MSEHTVNVGTGARARAPWIPSDQCSAKNASTSLWMSVLLTLASGLWSESAFAKLAIGGIVALGAALASAGTTLRRREFLTVPAVITSIESVNAGGKRVVFAYTAADGVTHESIDEVYAGNLRPGDDCLAVYPADRPHLGSLRVLPS